MHEPEITALLARACGGDKAAENILCELIYRSLVDRARMMLRGKSKPFMLSSGTLVHEAFKKLFRSGTNLAFENRAQFYLIAANAMRQVIIDHARKRMAAMRGGGRFSLPLEDIDVPQGSLEGREDVIAIDQACDRLMRSQPLLAQVVQLRFFGGLTIAEIAEILNVSETTVEKRWRLAKAFLHRELTAEKANGHAAGK
jgi:RNA polymerase sigma factor (TIGR02999 family)